MGCHPFTTLHHDRSTTQGRRDVNAHCKTRGVSPVPAAGFAIPIPCGPPRGKQGHAKHCNAGGIRGLSRGGHMRFALISARLTRLMMRQGTAYRQPDFRASRLYS